MFSLFLPLCAAEWGCFTAVRMSDVEHAREALRLLESEELDHMPLAAELRREPAGRRGSEAAA